MLVTGGAGFVGSHIADALRAAGHHARVFDARTGGDVRDADAVERALDGVDHVCHQAGMVGLGVDFLDVADYVSHNDLGTAVLLRALARTALPRAGSCWRRAWSSTARATTGVRRMASSARSHAVQPISMPAISSHAARAVARLLTPEAIGEDAPADPRNVYAATKLHQEHLAFAFARETGVPVTALRYHNVYGPRMPRDTPYAGVAAIFADALAAGRSPRVFEDGSQLRDFVHVRDVAQANLLALLAPEPAPGAFNVCSGTPRSVGEMARALRAAHGDAAPPVEVDRRVPARRRPPRVRLSGARRRRAGLHRAGGLRHRDGRARR